jgi:nitroreductase
VSATVVRAGADGGGATVGAETAARSSLLGDLVAAAVLAPSSHNTQPWAFRIAGGHLELRADRTRALPVNDPRDRELTMSCGAALLNARVAAARAGAGARVRLLPDPGDPDLLAVLRPVAGRPDGALPPFAAIAVRRTHRGPFTDRDVPGRLVEALVRAAALEGGRLTVLGNGGRARVVALVAEGDRLQFADPRWRRELAAWMHPRRKGDGLAVAELAAPATRFVVGHFDLGARTAAKDATLAEHSPVLAVLGTEGDEPADWLRAGQALQRVLLTAAGAGVQASFLNQPVQVDALRPRLAAAAGDVHPQVVLRLGFPDGTGKAAPRRPLAAVLEG